MPLQATSGAASYDAFGGGVPVSVNYIEDVFSTYLYTGTGVAQTITNGIDVSTKGGLVWIKARNVAGEPHVLVDSARGATRALRTSGTDAEVNDANRVSAFTTSGFSIGTDGELNGTGNTHASWTWRKQPKYFDVVTWTGSGANRTIAHNLGSVPGCIIVKRRDTTSSWSVYHRSLSNTQYLTLETTDDVSTDTTTWNSTTATSTVFSLGTDTRVNASGGTYVAYIFAHNAAGFGLTGTDNVISCGTFTTDGAGAATVNLGYEPQWLMFKASSGFGSWFMYDNMRGFGVTSDSNNYLLANSSGTENNGGSIPLVTSTGFSVTAAASTTYIYITIRRGPMKVPTVGTSVFSPNAYTGTGAVLPITGMGFPPDLLFTKSRTSSNDWCAQDKLRGPSQYLRPNGTIAELNLGTAQLVSIDQNGVTYGNGSSATNFSGATYLNLSFRRSPSFFDEVCYTGNGSTQTITHNLGVVPELIIGKNRTTTGNNWPVLFNFASTTMNYGFLNLTNSCPNDTYANVGVFSAAPTSTSMFLVNSGSMNTNTDNHVAYLFATCAGVSKVFSYTGNGSSQTINCGFTGGARFVLIKRTDSTGDWYVWDTARGIVSGNDPHLSINSNAAEVTTDDTIDTDSTGFVVNQVSATDVNVSSATYIGLAIA